MVALTSENTLEQSCDVVLTDEEKKSLIPDLLSTGKRDLYSGNFEGASTRLGKAAQYSDDIYGAKAPECFDSYYCYGKALLEIGRSEDNLIENAMKDMPLPDGDESESPAPESTVEIENPEDLTAEQRAEIREKVDDALMERIDEPENVKNAEEKENVDNVEEKENLDNAEEKENVDNAEEKVSTEAAVAEKASCEGAPEEAKDDEILVDENKSEETTDSEKAIAVEANGVDEAGDAENEDSAEDEDEADGEVNESQSEEPTSIQLAWEVLEAARLICDNQEQNEEWEIKKADVLISLAECSIEDENYKQAVDDLNIALELQLKYGCVGRVIAETYFTLARTFRLDDDFKMAAEFYEKALNTIEAKIVELETTISTAEEGEEKASAVTELTSLKELVPDIKMKVDDAVASAKQTEQAKEALVSALTASIPSVPADDKPTATIEFRKSVKRPAPEENSECDEAKKPKEDTVA